MPFRSELDKRQRFFGGVATFLPGVFKNNYQNKKYNTFKHKVAYQKAY